MNECSQQEQQTEPLDGCVQDSAKTTHNAQLTTSSRRSEPPVLLCNFVDDHSSCCKSPVFPPLCQPCHLWHSPQSQSTIITVQLRNAVVNCLESILSMMEPATLWKRFERFTIPASHTKTLASRNLQRCSTCVLLRIALRHEVPTVKLSEAHGSRPTMTQRDALCPTTHYDGWLLSLHRLCFRRCIDCVSSLHCLLICCRAGNTL